MSQAKKEIPAVVTFADHEVITPPNKLRKHVAAVRPGESHDDPVARAEAALAQLSTEFSSWMDTELMQLDRARNEVVDQGFSKSSHQALFHAAHDIKGEAATLGYPWVAPAADSLCRLLEHTPVMTHIPVTLVDQHVDAIRAIVRESARSDIKTVADSLTRRLREVTDEFLTHENRDRPEYLDGIVSPPLAPGDHTL